MSADLFAEFAGLNSNSSRPNHAAQSQSPPKPTTTTSTDPFAFLFSPSTQTASPLAFHTPTQPWPSIQPQQQQQQQQQVQNASNGWGTPGSVQASPAMAQQPFPQLGGRNTAVVAGGGGAEEDDDEFGWGDFMEAPSTTSTKPPPSALGSGLASPTVPPESAPAPLVRNRVLRADTMDLMSNNLVGLACGKPAEPWQGRPSWETTTTTPATKPPESLASPPLLRPVQPTPIVSVPKPTPTTTTTTTNSDVLFDADDFGGVPPPEDEDEDDFGDFETVDTKPAPVQPAAPGQPALADLISIDFGAPSPQASLSNFSTTATATTSVASQTRKQKPPAPLLSSLSLNTPSLNPSPLYPHAPKSPSFSERNPFPGLAVTTPISGSFPADLKDDDKEKSPTPVTAWPGAQSAIDKDGWDAFADFPPDASATTPAGPSAASSSWDWDAVDTPQPAPPRRTSKTSSQRKASAHEEVIGPPPTNVPPPSILLSVFPELLEEADVRLYKPTANQTPAVRSRVYADPATLDYLRGYLVLSTVAARVLAGRKHRWHRDKFLSQGMSISAAGSKGGMKLAGIDKTQAAREDREAADVVGVWRDHVGKLKSAVAAANIGLQKQVVKMSPLKVPEINDHMAVTTAKVVPTAPKACCVCGLKRDERVKGVDFDVEDSFGEWWVEHWGHRACRNFWLGNEERLRSR